MSKLSISEFLLYQLYVCLKSAYTTGSLTYMVCPCSNVKKLQFSTHCWVSLVSRHSTRYM